MDLVYSSNMSYKEMVKRVLSKKMVRQSNMGKSPFTFL